MPNTKTPLADGSSRVKVVSAPLQPSSAVDTESLFASYAPYVAFVAIRILGRDDDVDDVVQDVFEAALRGLRHMANPEPHYVKAWLATTTVHMSTRRLRRRKLLRRLGFESFTSELPSPPFAGGTPEQAALAVNVYRVLDEVPLKHRVAWTMHKLEEETLPTVAAALGCSLATAKRWIASTQEFVAARVGGRDK